MNSAVLTSQIEFGRTIFSTQRHLFVIVGVFGFFTNVLMLTAPIFALQVYDRVLSSRSFETLSALMLLATFLFLTMGFLDYVRKRIAARIGERVATMLIPAAFHAATNTDADATLDNHQHLKHLDHIRQFFSSPVFTALYDLVWVPVFLFAIAIFHPWLGVLATAGAVVLTTPILMHFFAPNNLQNRIEKYERSTSALISYAIRNPALIRVLGMRQSVLSRWQNTQRAERFELLGQNDSQNALRTALQTFRIFLQSAMIGMGAYLVLLDQLTPGAIIASTVLLARALGPLDTLGQSCAALFTGLGACRSSAMLLQTSAVEASDFPVPIKAGLFVQQISIFPPYTKIPAVRMVSFQLDSGQAMGVIGPTGAGKSALAHSIAGIWARSGGEIRIGGASAHSLSADVKANHIGYLPQDARLIDGTIAENIAKFDDRTDSSKIVSAAKNSAAHEMIMNLSAGYETWLSAESPEISAGLVQRILLARTIVDEPNILIFDEPAANLDDLGLRAFQNIVNAAKSCGKCVIILTQRIAVVSECELIMVLDRGVQKAFGPRETVLHGTEPDITRLHSAVS